MEEKDAIKCLADIANRKPSEIGEAVNILHQKFHSYDAIAERLNTSHTLSLKVGFLRSRHLIFKLPKGIRWKIDEEKIGISQASSICRLERESDQWLLALAAVEKNISAFDCERVVNLVLRDTWTIRKALSTVPGVRFEEISPPVLLLPVRVDFWYVLSRSAWDKGMDWQDFCYQLIRQGLGVDLLETAARLEDIAISLRKAIAEVNLETIMPSLTTDLLDAASAVKPETDTPVASTDPPAMLL